MWKQTSLKTTDNVDQSTTESIENLEIEKREKLIQIKTFPI